MAEVSEGHSLPYYFIIKLRKLEVTICLTNISALQQFPL